MNQVENAPQLRFSGFADAWEQREFKKTFSLLQNNTLSRAELSESSGVAANIHYGDVLIKFGEYLDMLQETFPWIKKQADADKFRTSFLQDGDVVFADTAEDETAGKCCEIRNCRNTMIISGLHTIPCRPVSKFAPGYLGYYLNSTSFREQLVPLMQGTKVVSISKAALKSTLIQYPSNDKEQHKIGTLFRRIDHLITLHQRKQDVLTKAKNALLEKMFPQDDEKTPQVRFNGFNDAWEQRKLGDFGTISMCKRVFKNQTSKSGEIPFFKIGTFGGQADAYISNTLFEQYAKKYPYPQKGDILISAAGSIGKTVEFEGKREYFQDSNIVWIKHDEALKNSFLKYFYEIVKWAGLEGSTIKRLYNGIILNTPITLPRSGEQEKIGALFRNLDSLISLHQRKVEKLKKLKMACLEKMFV